MLCQRVSRTRSLYIPLLPLPSTLMRRRTPDIRLTREKSRVSGCEQLINENSLSRLLSCSIATNAGGRDRETHAEACENPPFRSPPPVLRRVYRRATQCANSIKYHHYHRDTHISSVTFTSRQTCFKLPAARVSYFLTTAITRSWRTDATYRTTRLSSSVIDRPMRFARDRFVTRDRNSRARRFELSPRVEKSVGRPRGNKILNVRGLSSMFAHITHVLMIR